MKIIPLLIFFSKQSLRYISFTLSYRYIERIYIDLDIVTQKKKKTLLITKSNKFYRIIFILARVSQSGLGLQSNSFVFLLSRDSTRLFIYLFMEFNTTQAIRSDRNMLGTCESN
jgi:hypothetical protein